MILKQHDLVRPRRPRKTLYRKLERMGE